MFSASFLPLGPAAFRQPFSIFGETTHIMSYKPIQARLAQFMLVFIAVALRKWFHQPKGRDATLGHFNYGT